MPTTGERLVRTDFNVSASSDVDEIKRAAAELIDRIEALDGSLPDAGRHKALAITNFEQGAMWAVKAATATATATTTTTDSD